jgi:hypothetical protein
LRNAAASLRTFLAALPEEPAADASASQDAQLIADAHHKMRSPLRWVRSRGEWTSTLVLGNAFDHALAIERVLEGGEPINVWPCVSLSRIVMEDCTRVCHLKDPHATREQRFVRSAAAWLDSCQQHLTAAREFYPDRTLTDRFRMKYVVGLGSWVLCRQDLLGVC